jgi:hypothetical protein
MQAGFVLAPDWTAGVRPGARLTPLLQGLYARQHEKVALIRAATSVRYLRPI